MSNDDIPGTDAAMDHESMVNDLHALIGSLTEREQMIIKYCFGIGTREISLEEIGDRLGLTRERVRQIKEKAIRRLRESTSSDLLRKYLG